MEVVSLLFPPIFPHLGMRKRGGNNKETASYVVLYYIDISIQLASNTKRQLRYSL